MIRTNIKSTSKFLQMSPVIFVLSAQLIICMFSLSIWNLLGSSTIQEETCLRGVACSDVVATLMIPLTSTLSALALTVMFFGVKPHRR